MSRRIVVIMAGGAGERFWPTSRRDHPKQLLPLTGGDSMLKISVDRVANKVGLENIYILTGSHLSEKICEYLPELPAENIIGEPVGRNTAPCLGLALAHTGFGEDAPTMAVLTADHFIEDLDRFDADIETAFCEAEKGESLVTMGIPPTHPDTGFGYLETGDQIAEVDGSRVLRIKRFAEKPTLSMAKSFLDDGNFLWNSGMFFWNNATLYSHYEKLMPEMALQIKAMHEGIVAGNGDEVVNTVFPAMERISIDYGIMEKAPSVVCIRTTFKWDDIGTWEAVARINQPDADGNVAIGEVTALESKNCILYTEENSLAIATLGVDNLIVVASKDAVMVCNRDDAQRVKEIVLALKESGNEQLT